VGEGSGEEWVKEVVKSGWRKWWRVGKGSL